MQQVEYQIKKSRIARSFALAADSYDAYASLQRQVADVLLAELEPDTKPMRIVDLGSGTGYCTEKLQTLFPSAEIVSLDIAQAMLLFARRQHQGKEFAENFVCADAEALPFLEKSFDVIFSSLAIQWCHDYSILFTELKRVLKANGSIYLSTFGPETLKEVKQAWQQVDNYIHVNHFIEEAQLQQILMDNGFKSSKIYQQNLVKYYQTFSALARELKSIGARNMNRGQAIGLNGRHKIIKVKQVFEASYRPGKGIPVTYNVHYIKLQA